MPLVGVAKVDVTPSFPILLNGYGYAHREAEATHTAQRIYAKALAFTGDAGTSVLIAVDSCLVPRAVTRAVRDALAGYGVPHEHVAVCYTHSHATPCLRDAAPGLAASLKPSAEAEAHIDEYTRFFTDALVRVAREALGSQVQGTLSWTQGRVKFAANRRIEAARDAPVDHDLAVLRVTDSAGRLRALFTSYACHCVSVTDTVVSGDWAGHAQHQLERRFPGVTAMVAIGCAGDVDPRGGIGVAQQGAEIADVVAALVSGGRWMEAVPPAEWHLFSVRLPLADGKSWIDYPLQTWRFGGLLWMAFLAGEPLSDFGLYLKGEHSAAPLWINGYANECDPAYLAPCRFLGHPSFAYEAGDANVKYYPIAASYTCDADDGVTGALTAALGLRRLLVSGSVLYVIEPDGRLTWRRHLDPAEGSASWSGPRQVGTGWNLPRKVFCGGGGTFYRVDRAGMLSWYRHHGHADGSPAWTGPRQVGSGWLCYRHLFSPGGGVVYGVRPNGDLDWLRHEQPGEGGSVWTGPRLVGTDWTAYKHLFAAPAGYVYGVRPNGDLEWWRHDGAPDGTDQWTGYRKVGEEWFNYVALAAGDTQSIYGLRPDGTLEWWRHDGQADGSFRWTGPRRVLTPL